MNKEVIEKHEGLIQESKLQQEYLKGYSDGFTERDKIERMSDEDSLSWARRTLFSLTKKTK